MAHGQRLGLVLQLVEPLGQVAVRGGQLTQPHEGVGGTTKIRTYLPLGLGFTVETFTGTSIASTAAATPTELYFHKDRLGSLEAVTAAAGAVKQRFAYDAWGRRRNLDGTDVDWQALPSGGPR
jgi:hypothetical protein